MISKITLQHIPFTTSVMTVRYASQVLSKTVAVAMRQFEGEDSFFDCFNTRHPDENDRKHF